MGGLVLKRNQYCSFKIDFLKPLMIPLNWKKRFINDFFGIITSKYLYSIIADQISCLLTFDDPKIRC